MITFKTLSLRNFLSYGNNVTVFQLDQPGTTLIVGEDLDNTSEGQGSNGVGKAQPLHCKIKTPSGWTTMGDVQIGDLITTPSGETASVVGVFPQGVRPTYRVTFSDGRTTEADEEHLWTVFSHRWPTKADKRGTRTITTTELQRYVEEAEKKRSAWYNIFVPVVVHPTTEDVDLPVDPYLLGCLLGDGSFVSRDVRFSNSDQQCVNRVNRLLREECSQELVSYDHSINYCVRGYGSHTNNIANALTTLGLIGCNSHTKFIPEVYKHASARQKLQLLQGLMDTDGTIGKTANVSYCSTSKILAHDVQYLIRSLGGKATLTHRTPTYTHGGGQCDGHEAYYLSIAYPTPADLFAIDRKKHQLLVPHTQYANAGLRVVGVERIEDQPCQCIMIDHPDHLYITDDFVVTHNTTMLQGLVYALFGRIIGTDVTVDGLINNINKEQMEVTLEFIADNGVTYKVIRQRKMKKGPDGNNLFLYENGTDISVGVDGTNQKIEEVLGMNFDLFVRIIVFSASNNSFLKLPGTSTTGPNQRDFLEDLFGLSVITQKADKLKGFIKDTKASMDLKKAQLDARKAEHERHLVQIEHTQRRLDAWETQRVEMIRSLEAKLKRIDGVDVVGQRAIHQKLRQVDTTRKEIAADKTAVSRECRTHGATFTKIESEIATLRENKCPHCKQQYAGAAAEIDGKVKEMEQIEESLVALSQRLQECNEMLEDLDALYEQLQAQVTVENVEEIARIQADAENIRARVAELKVEANPHTEMLEELKAVKLEEINYDEINALQREIDHQNFLLKLLTKNDSFVRKSLLNKYLPFLNGRLQYYLQMLGLPHTVEFQEDLTAKISLDDKTEMKFGQLSTGQKARVDFAFSVAFKDVRERLHGRTNICMFDEVLDFGLDAVGVIACAKVIKHLARTEGVSMYVISHRNEIDSMFDRKMTIQMVKKFSYVRVD